MAKLELQLHTHGRAKYVLLKNMLGDMKLVSRPGAEFHQNILFAENCKLEGNSPLRHWSCCGGGRIDIDESEIYVYGYSVDYGKPKEEDVKAIFEANKQDPPLPVRIEIGVGY